MVMFPMHLKGQQGFFFELGLYYTFLECGGNTEVTIIKGKKRIMAGTQCRDDENFCYKLGIQYALKAIPQEVWDELIA